MKNGHDLFDTVIVLDNTAPISVEAINSQVQVRACKPVYIQYDTACDEVWPSACEGHFYKVSECVELWKKKTGTAVSKRIL